MSVEPITGIIEAAPPALLPASPLVRHAVCHHLFLDRPVPPWPTLCGRQTQTHSASHALPRCPDCASAARVHGSVCDCWKRGRPGATVPL